MSAQVFAVEVTEAAVATGVTVVPLFPEEVKEYAVGKSSFPSFVIYTKIVCEPSAEVYSVEIRYMPLSSVTLFRLIVSPWPIRFVRMKLTADRA
jgi:hypothetical protein